MIEYKVDCQRGVTVTWLKRSPERKRQVAKMMLMEAALLLDLSMLGLDDQVLSWCAEQVILAFT